MSATPHPPPPPRDTPHTGPGVRSAAAERDLILTGLRARHPDLAARTVTGPSGALLVPLGRRGQIEVGRMRRGGRSRWVVVAPGEDGVRVTEAAGVRAALAVIEGELGGPGGPLTLLRSRA